MPATDQSAALVLQPLDIGGVRIPNRIARTAHFTGYAFGAPNDMVTEYHLARARGGVGLTFLEAAAVHPSSMLGLTAFDDSVVAATETLMSRIEPTGMKVFQQLFHGGNHYAPPGGLPTRGVSAFPSPEDGFPAVPFSTGEVGEIVLAYAAAARRVVAGGIHGIEVHAGHGYLPEQFLSARLNTRDDVYGGSRENRMRFCIEVLREVRAAVPGVPVGIRVSAGRTLEEVADLEALLRCLDHDGLLDFVSASIGNSDRPSAMLGGSDQHAGYQLPFTRAVTHLVTGVPRIVTGRFRTLAEAEQVLRTGDADMISMVRAHIADPHVVEKTRRGEADRVRPCIGCNQGCLGRVSNVDMRMGCTVNPAAGNEATLGEELIGTTGHPRTVVVVGGGPAGMEAARTARLRGHRVTLIEAADELGGALRTVREAPNLADFGELARWQAGELAHLGVEVRTGLRATEDDVLALAPDVVVVATGATARRGPDFIAAPGVPVAGLESDHVHTSSSILARRDLASGSSAVVYDDMGQYEAIAVVDHLLGQGVEVTVATRLPAFAGPLDFSLRTDAALERFHRTGSFRSLERQRLIEIGPDVVWLRPEHARERAEGRHPDDLRLPADVVVIVGHKTSDTALAGALAGKVGQVHLVGDAHWARDLQTAIRDGHLAGRGID